MNQSWPGGRSTVVAVALMLMTSSCGGDDTVEPTLLSTTTPETETSLTAQSTFAPQPGSGVPVVVDYSPTSSDVTALLFLLQHSEVRVDAITIPGTGESHCDAAVANTLGLLVLVGKEGIPVACGSSEAMAGQNQWPDAWRDTADQLPGLSLPAGGEPSSLNGPELLSAAVKQSTQPVKLLTLGPLTNVAQALAADPSLVNNLETIYIMGGAVETAGNVFANDVAEWNIWIDPAGAQTVFDAGAPIVLVPLDATNSVPVTRRWYGLLADQRSTPAAGAVFDLFTASPGVLDGGFFFWDELAAAVLVDPSYVTLEDMTLSSVQEGVEDGRTKRAADGVQVQVAVSVDTARFERDLLSILNGGGPVEIEAADPELVVYFMALESLAERFNAGISQWFEDNEEALVAVFDSGDLPLEQVREANREFLTTAMGFLRADLTGTQALDVPAGAEAVHQAYLTAVEAVLATESEALNRIGTASSAELTRFSESGFGLPLEDLSQACSGLQTLANAEHVNVDLLCSEI